VPTLLAAAPIVLILVLMGLRRWPAAKAGALGLVLALALALTVFDLGATAGVAPGPAAIGTLAETLHASTTILWIILPALTLFELQRRSHAIERIRQALTALTQVRRLQALMIAWFFALFMEGAAGFGTPVALAAPLLVGIGFPPVRAVVLALLGHAAGVSFGAVGTPVLTQAEITGIDGRQIAAATALLHALVGSILLLTLVRLAGDQRLCRRDLVWSAGAALCFFVPSTLLAAFAGPELPTLGGALIGSLVFAALLWRVQPRPTAEGGATGDAHLATGVRTTHGVGDRRLLADIAPYALILVLVLATRLLPGVRAALTSLALDWQIFGTYRGRFEPLFHPGSLLFVGLFASAVLTGRVAHVLPSLAAALRRLGPVAVALLAMLALSRVMVHSGMIDELASAAARAGAVWPLLAPAVGVLGTFVTGSATASNILFSEFQLGTATALALSPIAMLAAQSFGAAIGNIVAPHNIIAGAATVGLKDREGEVLAKTLLPCVLVVLAGGLLLLVFTAIG
jgi:lactate permease